MRLAVRTRKQAGGAASCRSVKIQQQVVQLASAVKTPQQAVQVAVEVKQSAGAAGCKDKTNSTVMMKRDKYTYIYMY